MMSKVTSCGIYAIRNKSNGNQYIGQSIDISHRFAKHFRELERNTHYNKHLQQAWNNYGKDNFDLLILELCDPQDLPEMEQVWIDKHKRNDLYNMVFDVQYRQGDSNPFFGKNHTKEAKHRMSIAKKASYRGKGNPNFGKKHTLDTRIKISEGQSNKLTRDTVLQIVQSLKEGLAHQKIANRFEVGRTTVTRIATGESWTNVTGGPVCPVVYDENGKRQFTELHRRRIGDGHRGFKHSEATKSIMSKKAYERHIT